MSQDESVMETSFLVEDRKIVVRVGHIITWGNAPEKTRQLVADYPAYKNPLFYFSFSISSKGLGLTHGLGLLIPPVSNLGLGKLYGFDSRSDPWYSLINAPNVDVAISEAIIKIIRLRVEKGKEFYELHS